jgi:protein-tyrosine kinase
MSLFDLKKKIASKEEEAPKGAGDNVIEIPIPSERGRRYIPDPLNSEENHADAFEGNQFKSLKTKLLFPPTGKRLRTVAVTSPGVGEGKTFIAANLAIALALNFDERHIILMDCDVRLPSAHKLLKFENGITGLSEYLSGNLPLESVVLKTRFENLSILSGGRSENNTTELLSSRKMLDILDEIPARYEDSQIILDLPSPRLVAEAELIAGRLDGVIVVVKYGSTTKNQLNELINIVGRENILGLVFNQFDPTMHSSVYRMYRKYIRRK